MSIEKHILHLVKMQDPVNPLAYVHDLVREFAMEKLIETLANYQGCVPLDEPRSIPVGNVRAPIMVISDKPQKEQFANNHMHSLESTDALTMLNKVWNHFGIQEDNLFYMDAINFIPYRQVGEEKIERIPSKTEVEAHVPFLLHAIDIVRPKAVLLLGPIVSNLFKQEAFTKIRGEVLSVKGIYAMATYHPNTLLNLEGKLDEDSLQDKKDEFVDDISKLIDYVQTNFPQALAS